MLSGVYQRAATSDSLAVLHSLPGDSSAQKSSRLGEKSLCNGAAGLTIAGSSEASGDRLVSYFCHSLRTQKQQPKVIALLHNTALRMRTSREIIRRYRWERH